MKILLTGMTRLQTRPSDTSETYYGIFNGYAAALRLAGHEVDWRPVTPGEELRGKYEAALVGIHGVGSMSCTTHKCGALWACHELPHAVLLEDWRVRTVAAHLKNSGYFWNGPMVGNTQLMRRVNPVRKEIERVRYRWERELPMAVLPMMSWGDPATFEALHRCRGSMAWNVDPVYRWHTDHRAAAVPVELARDVDRRREWTLLSACSDASSWLEKQGALQWPVMKKWRPKSERGAGGAQRQSRAEIGFIPEDRLIREVYSKVWGTMMMGYGRESLVGWWRNRYFLSAYCGTVLVTDATEHGHQAHYDYDCKYVEARDHKWLSTYAALQASVLRQQTLSLHDSVAQFSQVLERLTPPEGSHAA